MHIHCDETAHVLGGSDGSDEADEADEADGLDNVMPDSSGVFDCLEDLDRQHPLWLIFWFWLIFMVALGLTARKAHRMSSAVHAKLKEIKTAQGPW